MRSGAEIEEALKALKMDLGPLDRLGDVVLGVVPGIGDPGRQRRLGRIEALEWVMKQRGSGPTAINDVIKGAGRSALLTGSLPKIAVLGSEAQLEIMGGGHA